VLPSRIQTRECADIPTTASRKLSRRPGREPKAWRRARLSSRWHQKGLFCTWPETVEARLLPVQRRWLDAWAAARLTALLIVAGGSPTSPVSLDNDGVATLGPVGLVSSNNLTSCGSIDLSAKGRKKR
jgi:hypothetical protein